MKNNNTTITGTNIDEVKQRNAQSGLSYNEAKVELAKKMGYLASNQANKQ